MSNLSVIIVGAGKGTRMKSNISKLLHKVGNLEMINHVINTAKQLDTQEICVVCSEENIEEINTRTIINKEIIRINELMYKAGFIESKEDLTKLSKEKAKKLETLKYFSIAMDNFVVYRPSFRYHTIIAGYPWFLDWGRDALISFEGLLLMTKQYRCAKEVLLTLTRDIKFGLVLNGYSGYDNRPLYNSVDASLILFEQVQKYLNYTSDYEFVKQNIYKKLITFKWLVRTYMRTIFQ